MRFLLYDAVTHLEKGKSITGLKSFSLSEEFLRGHYTKTALVPGTIMIEVMAQLLGWLINCSHDLRLLSVLSLIEGVTVSPGLRPGFTAEVRGEIISTSRRDSLGKAEMLVDGAPIASAERIIYSHIQTVDQEEMIRLFRYYSGLKNYDIQSSRHE